MLASTVLRNKGYDVFLPLVRRGTRRILERPLFSGYIFCRFDPQIHSKIVTTPGVLRIVHGSKGCPLPVDDKEIASIRIALGSQMQLVQWKDVSQGALVVVEGGPLKGAEGIFVRVGPEHRLVVGLSLLQRWVSVKLEPEWVRLCKPQSDVIRPQTAGPISADIRLAA